MAPSTSQGVGWGLPAWQQLPCTPKSALCLLAILKLQEIITQGGWHSNTFPPQCIPLPHQDIQNIAGEDSVSTFNTKCRLWYSPSHRLSHAWKSCGTHSLVSPPVGGGGHYTMDRSMQSQGGRLFTLPISPFTSLPRKQWWNSQSVKLF